MAVPSIPQGFIVQQGNNQVFLSWNITAGATSYSVQRSTDGVTYSSLATPAVVQYLDTAVSIGTQYWYKVAAINGDGTGLYAPAQSIIPTPTGEMSLAELRATAQQRADMVNNNFLTTQEWNANINQCMMELYDLLITLYEDYYKAPNASFITDGSTAIWPLPNGQATYINDSGQNFVAAPIYKLLGVDLGLNNANNAYVTIKKYDLIRRNDFVFPNTASTIYGVFNLRYRWMGNNLEFTPTPSAGQRIRVLYIPRIPKLLADTDITTTGISGWSEYIVVKAAIMALAKEESDTSALTQQLKYQIERITSSASNRDAGQPDTISDVRMHGNWGGWGSGNNGPIGGW